VANPGNWFRLASPYFSRIDIAAEYYHEEIFEEKRFQALADGGRRPFVILNATNLANGGRFEFTPAQFDFLASGLGIYPVARTVAASPAFPFLLSPVSLKNYPHPVTFELPKDYIESEYRRSSGFIRKLINDGAIEKFVLIIVNARPDSGDTISKDESPPGLSVVAVKTATIAMDNYSVETIEVMKELRDMRVRAQNNIAACRRLLAQCTNPPKLPGLAADIEPYVIEISFEAIPDPERRKYFLRLPTNFALSRDQVDALVGIGPVLLDEAPEFKDLLESLKNP